MALAQPCPRAHNTRPWGCHWHGPSGPSMGPRLGWLIYVLCSAWPIHRASSAVASPWGHVLGGSSMPCELGGPFIGPYLGWLICGRCPGWPILALCPGWAAHGATSLVTHPWDMSCMTHSWPQVLGGPSMGPCPAWPDVLGGLAMSWLAPTCPKSLVGHPWGHVLAAWPIHT